MSKLVKGGAQFGVSMEDSFKNTEQLADALRTDNLPAVAETVSKLQMIPGALVEVLLFSQRSQKVYRYIVLLLYFTAFSYVIF